MILEVRLFVDRRGVWKWSSLAGRLCSDALLWRGEVVVRDERWLERVNEPLSAGDLQRLRLSVERGRPYGEDSWAKDTARRLGLESTLRSRGQIGRASCRERVCLAV